ncbi:alpha/beta hydrolase [Catellatospora bangladeshensis]|uniref:Acetylhydrolase n=1 Tax=Catellatospora bangladeshensis TaxID=310355 RepID=A0A8J3NGZ0_9ACTN|nr:alpha/beta hydrolase [Catellatospora bangladeshensis]GIF78701.1 acetylhydrolase [Catellatospora bangladeshensis]
MPLHPQVQAMRTRREASRTPQLYTLSVDEARAADLASIQASGGDPEHVAEVTDREIPGPGGPLPIRIYRPVTGTELPVLVYFFGGGWTLGTIDTSDAVCRSLANATGCLVVSAGYRLAPEHRFPAAVHDCHAAVRWVAEHAAELGADPARIAVGGDSAGGNLAAAVTLLARADGDLPLAGQLLVYPNTDYHSHTASMRDGTDPYLFNATSVAWYWANYLTRPEDGLDPLASPLRAETLTGLPPALVITAEYDPLRDQAEEYARRLGREGVPVTLTRYDGMVHGFFCMGGELEAGRRALAQAAQQLRTWFAG